MPGPSRRSPFRIAGRRNALSALLVAAIACGTSAPDQPTPPGLACTPTAGALCFGRNQFIEYNGGDLPIVISVPHGGALTPASIPNRTIGTTVTDTNTIELGRAIVQALVTRTGRAPHLVLCQLRRTKLDANRELAEAAAGNAEAIQAWVDYHDFISMSVQEVVRRHGRGLFIDLHGHGHPTPRLELGYLLSASVLNRSDAELDAGSFATQSSLRLATGVTSAKFSELLRGATSLGGLLATHTAAVPAPGTPSPGTDPYFDGGYSTERHSAVLPALQIESHLPGIRDTPASRAAFAEALASALATFLSTHLGLAL